MRKGRQSYYRLKSYNLLFFSFIIIMVSFLIFKGVAMTEEKAAPAKEEVKSSSTDVKKDEKPAEKPAEVKKDDKPTDKPAEGTEEKPKEAFEFNPSDPHNPIYMGSSGVFRSTGDPTKSGYASEAARLGAGWHPQAMEASELPRDKFGLINWVELVKKGAIDPRPTLTPDPKFKEMIVNLNILFKMKGDFVDNVIFPHDLHTYWLDCVNCHNEIFFQFAGWNPVKMQEIVKGEWCGRCHGRVAFPLADCTRCHKYPNGDPIETAKGTTKRRPKPQ